MSSVIAAGPDEREPPEASDALDVSRLPEHASGQRTPLWWGVVLLVAIESTTMGLLLVSYFYLRGNYAAWPPSPVGATAVRLASAQAVLLALSYAPMVLAARAARRERLRATRSWLLLATVLGALVLVLRAFEIPRIGFRWDDNAYGSLFWMTLGLHITHLLTGVVENAVLLALLWLGPVERKHFTDVEVGALLWYFAVLEWAPGFTILYLEPLLFPR
jgi:cytochrome c oxidase subunit 3